MGLIFLLLNVAWVWDHSEDIFGLGYAYPILPNCYKGNLRLVEGDILLEAYS